MLRNLQKILHSSELLLKYINYLSVIALSVLFILMISDVAVRTVSTVSLKGTAEISAVLLIAVAFLALGYGQIKGVHVSVETFANYLPKNIRIIIRIILYIAAAAFFTIMAIQVADRGYTDYVDKVFMAMTNIAIPVYIQNLIAFIGVVLLVLSFIIQILRDILSLTTKDYSHS